MTTMPPVNRFAEEMLSDSMRAPSDRSAVDVMASGGFVPEHDAPVTHRERVIKYVWRKGEWVEWNEQTPLPERARGPGGQRVGCQFAWITDLAADDWRQFWALRFHWTGEPSSIAEHGISTTAEENIMRAMKKAHERYVLDPSDISWPAGWPVGLSQSDSYLTSSTRAAAA